MKTNHHPNNEKSYTILLIAFFLLVTTLLVITNKANLQQVNFEAGDFAANSLLIQDAKTLSLWKGNYSRVGFNHPGPAILYVLAAGESILYDNLRVVQSPFSGQLAAVAVYSAFWITLIFNIFIKLSGSATRAALTTSAFCFLLTCADYQIVTGIWMPHLYVLPFAAMLLSGARLAGGYTDSVITLGLSVGFLINGHVSFIAINFIFLALIFVGNYLYFRKTSPSLVILSKRYLTDNKFALILWVVTTAIFFTPLLIETIRSYPGPLADYARFSGAHKANSLREALKFTAVYWGGIAYFVLGIIALLVVFKQHQRNLSEAYVLPSLLISMAAASAAFIFYVIFGVDMLNETYIGLFYYSVPVTAGCVFIGLIFRSPNSSSLRASYIVMALTLAVMTTQAITRQPSYQDFYNDSSLYTTYQTFRDMSSGSTIALDLDNSEEWGMVWGKVAGLTAIAKREGIRLFCVNTNWHILYTKELKCTTDEIANSRRFEVRGTKAQAGKFETAAVSGSGLVFYERKFPDLVNRGDVTVREEKALFKSYLLSNGWSGVEGDYVWSLGPAPTISLNLPQGFAGTVTLDLGAFIPNKAFSQQVEFWVDGIQVQRATFSRDNDRLKVIANIPQQEDGNTMLNIRIKHPISPKTAGLSNDDREIGIAIYSLNIESK